jgi:hypothetical protein
MTRWLLGVTAACCVLTAGFFASGAEEPENRDLVAVIVGTDQGQGDDEPLRYARSDARRVRDLLVELGALKPERALLVEEGGSAEVVQALQQAIGRASEIVGSGRRVSFLFYYSGHGDEQALHLRGSTLPLSELRALVAQVPADVHVSILDACRFGGRSRGTHRGPAFALATSPDSPHGSVELRAASAGEAAQESDELAGAVFTHFLVSGLRGAADSNRDARVTLAELYAYVFDKTLLRTTMGEATQHPALSEALAGTGELVLTRPGAAAATIDVPAGAERYLVFREPDDVLLGELGGERPGSLGLPAGRYLVVRRAAGRAAVAGVDLSIGGQRHLRSEDFRAVAREELVTRGGGVQLRRWRFEPRIGVEVSAAGSDGPALRVGAALSYSLTRFNLRLDPVVLNGRLELEVELAYVTGALHDGGIEGRQHTAALAPVLAIRFFPRWVTVALTLGLDVRYTVEELDEHAIIPLSLQAANYFSAGPRAGLRLTIPLGHDLTFGLSGAFSALIRGIGESSNASGLALQLSLRPVFSFDGGLGYQF